MRPWSLAPVLFPSGTPFWDRTRARGQVTVGSSGWDSFSDSLVCDDLDRVEDSLFRVSFGGDLGLFPSGLRPGAGFSVPRPWRRDLPSPAVESTPSTWRLTG